MAFPPGFLDELRGRISLADLIGRRVRLARRGREYGGLCPFHNEKTPSFYVVEDKGFFHCFGCGAHGDAIGYIMRADNLDFVEAIERLAGEAGLAVPQATPQERERAQRQKTLLEALAAAAAFYEAQLWAPAGTRAREYLTARGLDEETIRRFRLGWAPGSRETGDRQALRRALSGEFPEALLLEGGLLRQPEGGGSPYDYFRSRVIFPIGDRAGRAIAFGGRTLGDEQPKYLNSPDTPLFEKGRVLYAWAAARANAARRDDAGAAPAIVVEGYMDVIALHRAGFATAVAPLGTALTEAQLQELWRLSPEPVLCFDGDAAGQRASIRALDRALPLLQPGRSLQFARLPPGQDPDDFLRSYGPLTFDQEVLRGSQPLWKTLWNEEFNAKPTDTPERRADFRARLKARIDSIRDPVVRGEFWGFLLDRFYELVRSSRLAHLKRRRPERGTPDVPPLPRDPRPTQRAMLLFDLIELPSEISPRLEQITMLDFPESDLDKLRLELLEVADIHPEMDAESAHKHLGDNGFSETIGTLCSRISNHGLAKRGYRDPVTIRAELAELFRLLGPNERSDLEAAARTFGLDPTPQNWDRLQALKERQFMEDSDSQMGS
ncbi:MAG TPA: DNA primase [Stellaceae bacterium]|jgi:DNA primase|nr:DNA primase [Stellaceae bacterium]